MERASSSHGILSALVKRAVGQPVLRFHPFKIAGDL
jgi:hypothetical protein